MENSYNALIMVGSVLLFITALTVGVYTYSKILFTNNALLTNSEYNSRSTENFALADFAEDTERQYTGAEVAMQIINLYEGRDLSFKKITVKMNGSNYVYPRGGETLKPAETDPTVNKNYNAMINSHKGELNTISTSSDNVYFVGTIYYLASGGVEVVYDRRTK